LKEIRGFGNGFNEKFGTSCVLIGYGSLSVPYNCPGPSMKALPLTFPQNEEMSRGGMSEPLFSGDFDITNAGDWNHKDTSHPQLQQETTHQPAELLNSCYTP